MSEKMQLTAALMILGLLAVNVGFAVGFFRAKEQIKVERARAEAVMNLGENDQVWHMDFDQIWAIKKGGK